MKPSQIARVVHEANRALQTEINDPNNKPSKAWDDLDAETRESAVTGVLKVIDGETPEQLHQSWCEFKWRHGWTYGPHKDQGLKRHPSLVPYDELPESEKIKDHLFHAIVNTLKDN